MNHNKSSWICKLPYALKDDEILFETNCSFWLANARPVQILNYTHIVYHIPEWFWRWDSELVWCPKKTDFFYLQNPHSLFLTMKNHEKCMCILRRIIHTVPVTIDIYSLTVQCAHAAHHLLARWAQSMRSLRVDYAGLTAKFIHSAFETRKLYVLCKTFFSHNTYSKPLKVV
jgi:hypothetical protein